MRRSILAVLTWLLISSAVSAQQYFFRNYGVKEGLLQSNVLCGMQDKAGYLWLGTEGGLSRFDGKDFQNYTREDGLAESNVTAIYEDRDGRIWLGHQNGGLSIVQNGTFSVISDSLLTKTISVIHQSENGRMWIGTMGDGAISFLPDSIIGNNPQYQHFRGKDGLSDYVFSISEDKSSTLWLVTDIGLKTRKKGSNTFDFEKIEGMPSFQITTLLHDKDRNVWLGTYQGGLYRYTPANGMLKAFRTTDGLSSDWISTLYQDKEKNMWVGTWGGGISCIRGEKITQYDKSNGLEDVKIRTIFQDREGNMVIGTNEHGFSIYSGERFVMYNRLQNNQVWAVVEYDGRLYLGHNKGIDVLENGSTVPLEGFDAPVRSMCKDGKGRIWIGTWGQGVYTLRLSSGKVVKEDNISQWFDPNINTITRGNDGNIWVGTIKGLSKIDPASGQVQSFPGITGKVQLDIATVHHTSDEMLLGTRKNGLIRRKGKEFMPWLDNVLTAAPTSISSAGDKTFIGTEGGGVFIVKGQETTQHLTRKEGLLSNFILATGYDEAREMLWVVSNKGLSSYHLESGVIRNYDEHDGFMPVEGKLNSICITAEKVFVGSVGGLVQYNPSKDERNTVSPVINMTGMKLNLKDTLLESGVALPYNYNTLRFDFTSICLTNPDKVRHKAMLEGWDDWHPVDNTTINYSNLPEGEYTLLIKSANNDGVWNETPYRFNFTIHPPFWRTWWFYVFCVVVVIVGFFAFIKWREQKLQQEKSILAQKVQERTAEVVEKSEQLERAYEHITSSIVYAERIQRAILPSDKVIHEYFPNSFVFFQPRDIVSGDFYWLEVSGDEILFSAIDCTGHGVPGAFVSMVGHNLLNQSVRKHGLTRPADILDDLDREVKRTLQTNDESAVKDGMDLALCSYNPKKRRLQYAGAHNSLYHIRNGELTEHKANRFAIGYKGKDEGKTFDNVEMEIEEGDVIYVFSDGFADQFGGDKGRKYMSKRFKNYLIEHYKNDFEQQKEDLSKELKSWMSNKYKQIDDILIWGIRF